MASYRLGDHPRIRTGLKGTGAVVVACLVLYGAHGVMLWAGWDWYRRMPWADGDRGRGLILIADPVVYTRERLVNDRFQQQHWLQAMLEDTVRLTATGAFDSVQARGSEMDRRGIAARALVGFGGAPAEAEKDKKKDGETEKPERERPVAADGPRLEALPIDRFRDQSAYRDAIRQELMQTELDDSHDIAGNTLVRLDFNATVLPTAETSVPALIAVVAKEAGEGSKPELPREPYEDIYREWRFHLQTQYDAAVDNLTRLAQAKGGEIEKTTGQDLARIGQYMTREIVYNLAQYPQALSGIAITPDIVDSCIEFREAFMARAGEQQAAVHDATCRAYVLYRYVVNGLKYSLERRRAQSFEMQVRALAQKNPGLDNKLNSRQTGPDNVPRAAGSHTDPIQEVIKGWFVNATIQCRQSSTSAEGGGPSAGRTVNIEGDDLPCPELPDSVRDKLDADFLLFDFFHVTPAHPAERIASGVKGIAGHMSESLECQLRQDCRSESQPPEAILRDYTSREPQVRRAIAHYLANIIRNAEGDQDARSLVSKYYFVTVEDCGIYRCRLVLTPKGGGVNALKTALEENRMFTYAVNPKQLAERTHLRSEIGQMMQLLGQVRGNASGRPADMAAALSYFRESARSDEGLRRHPLVVGFAEQRGNSGGASRKYRSETMFGWLIRPPAARSGGRISHVAVERTLSATVSLPSWWRTLDLYIYRCWLPERSRGEFVIADGNTPARGKDLLEYCRKNMMEEPKPVRIDLPRSVVDISRHLGFQVIEEPYVKVSTTFTQQALEIGRPGQIVLEGGRLWRSTVVTLGMQRADQIIVTPHMQGIIAVFNCVLPPADWPSGRPRIVADFDTTTAAAPFTGHFANAVVWTSEGRTTPMPVTLKPFRMGMVQVAAAGPAMQPAGQTATKDTAGEKAGSLPSALAVPVQSPCWENPRYR